MGKKVGLALLGIISVGALVSLGLSFTALSPSVIGSIIGFSFVAAFMVMSFIEKCLDTTSKKKKTSREDIILAIATPIIAIAVSSALGAAANSLFPGVMSNMWTAALTGAAIVIVGTALTSLAACIAYSVITKVTECFPEKAPVNHLHITVSC